jgi:hypothetical protein
MPLKWAHLGLNQGPPACEYRADPAIGGDLWPKAVYGEEPWIGCGVVVAVCGYL